MDPLATSTPLPWTLLQDDDAQGPSNWCIVSDGGKGAIVASGLTMEDAWLCRAAPLLLRELRSLFAVTRTSSNLSPHREASVRAAIAQAEGLS